MASDERECRIERIRDMAGRLGNSVAYNWPIRNSEVRDCLVELYYLLGEEARLRAACHDVLVVGEDCLIQSRGMREVPITYVEVERWRLNELEEALKVLKGEVDA